MSDPIIAALLILVGTLANVAVTAYLNRRFQPHQIANTDASTQGVYVGIIATLQKTIGEMLSLQAMSVTEISGLHRELDAALKTIAESNARADRFEKLADERAAEIKTLTARVAELSKMLGLPVNAPPPLAVAVLES